ncbi:2-succinyl-5-enolpyruvyl-6-hydroxy-3-cyclohexene-1-carboxylic-acid synthase [Euzebya sp.]|uniref:2-succinyl-5-enolpyruvyl-6-hydroxy-3- cyclohexene-1-carboxylic-acid synthase n=1 Tax=Euzebya sp. TaxID=1971409 RepID=UPI0035129DE1
MLSATEIGTVLVDALVRQGVTDVVISPGSRSAPIALAAAAAVPRLHVRVDERSAGFLALGLARGSGRPAAVVCSSGTATANYHPAVIEADAAGVALIVLTADRPPEARGTGANQTIRQVGLYGDAVRFAADVVERGADRDERALRGLVATAVDHADGLHPGPVHLNIPLREPLLDPDRPPPTLRTGPPGAGEGASWVRGLPPRPVEERPAGIRPDAVLDGRPAVLVAGEGALAGPSPLLADTGLDIPDADRILAAAERLGLPVIAEPTSGLRRGTALRCGHWLAASEAFVAAMRPQVVVQLGRPVLSRPTSALVAGAEEVVTIDPWDRGWDPGRHTTHLVRRTFDAWTADLPDADGAVLSAWRDADRRAAAVLDDELDRHAGMSELGTARDVAAAVPAGGHLVVASSLPVRHLDEAMVPAPIHVVGNRGASGIDGFTSTAIGVALGAGGPTVALAGDLSIVHDLTGLVMGPDEPRPSLPVVVLNNDGGGIFHLLPYGEALDEVTFRRLFATPHGVSLHGLAMTVGVGYTHVDDPAELGQVLADAWATPDVTLVEVRTDTPAETARYHRTRRAIAAAVDPRGR